MLQMILLSHLKRRLKALYVPLTVSHLVPWRPSSSKFCELKTNLTKVSKLTDLRREAPPDVRQSLVQALLKHLPEPSSPVVLVARPDQPRPTPIRTDRHRETMSNQAYDPSVAFVLELCTILASPDKPSIAVMGEAVADALQNVVRDASNIHILVLSRAVYYLFHLMNASQALQDQSLVKTPVVLHTIAGFDQLVLEQAAETILKGLALCIQLHTSLRNEVVNTPDFWLILSNLHTFQRAAPAVFDLVENVVLSDPCAVTADNYMATVSLLDNFATAGSVGAATEQQESKRQQTLQQRDRRGQRSPEAVPTQPSAQHRETVLRGYKAVVLISQLVQRVPDLIRQSHLDREKAWMTYWSLIFQKLQTQCLNPCRKIRRQACSSLQNALLSPNLSPSADEEWALIFRTILFGLISRLLKPEVYQTDPTGMNETRLQAANILCRTFLHHLPLLSQREDMLELWLRILDIMDRLMNSGQGDNLEEAVPESLKNILLVMAGSEVLNPPSSGEQPSELWEETYKRVDRFLPNFMSELFPKAEGQPQGVSSARASSDASKQSADGIAEPTTESTTETTKHSPEADTTREDES